MTTIDLDVRGLQPPEPLERVLEALDRIGADDRIVVKFDRRPTPLYRILERNGCVHEEAQLDDAVFEVTIRRRTTP